MCDVDTINHEAIDYIYQTHNADADNDSISDNLDPKPTLNSTP